MPPYPGFDSTGRPVSPATPESMINSLAENFALNGDFPSGMAVVSEKVFSA
jgi:hypothetical protein